jgi:hypothetical protein
MGTKIIFFVLGASVLLHACTGSSKVEIGNKTTMAVNLVYDAGKVIKGEVVNAVFTIKNTGEFPLVIGDASGSCSCTVAEKPDQPIPPGESGIVKAYVTTLTSGNGPIRKTVTIVANTEPSRTEVSVLANVIEK